MRPKYYSNIWCTISDPEWFISYSLRFNFKNDSIVSNTQTMKCFINVPSPAKARTWTWISMDVPICTYLFENTTSYEIFYAKARGQQIQPPTESLAETMWKSVISVTFLSDNPRRIPSKIATKPSKHMNQLSMCLCVCSIWTEGHEVKVGEYNAIADVLDLINNSIRFQGIKSTLWVSECILSVTSVLTEDKKDVLMHLMCVYIRV